MAFLDLLLRHRHITGQFAHFNAEVAECGAELVNDFRGEGLEWRDVDDLELFVFHVPGMALRRVVSDTVGKDEADFTQDRQKSDVRFTRTSGRRDEKIARLLERDRVHDRLYAVQVRR